MPSRKSRAIRAFATASPWGARVAGRHPGPVRPRRERPHRRRPACLARAGRSLRHPPGQPASQHGDGEIGRRRAALPHGVVEKRDHIRDVRPDGVRRPVLHAAEVQTEVVHRRPHRRRQSLVDLACAHRLDRPTRAALRQAGAPFFLRPPLLVRRARPDRPGSFWRPSRLARPESAPAVIVRAPAGRCRRPGRPASSASARPFWSSSGPPGFVAAW